MLNRATKLRWRRRIRRSKHHAQDISFQAEENLEKHFIKRLSRLSQVRRFVAAWLLLLALIIGGLIVQIRALSDAYQALTPIRGGIYTEGIIGRYTDASPLFATGSANNSVTKLVFAGLFKHDEKNQLTPDLAESYSIDQQELVYTVKLKPGLTWHDGQPLTARDVEFTYKVIQNPDAESPLASNWRGINITAEDELTIKFVLPNTLTAFPHSLTNGIVPKHLLDGVTMSQLRSLNFNTVRPVGAGPFKLQSVEVSGITPAEREQRLGFVPFENYHAGRPKLNRLIIRTFRDKSSLVEAFNNHEINAMVGLERTPEELVSKLGVREHNFPLTSAAMVFFNTSVEPFNDAAVRKALTLAADRQEIVVGLGYPVITANQPILKGQLGYAADLAQPTNDPAEANRLLEEAGWQAGSEGIRQKAGKDLTFRLYSENTSVYTYITQVLQKQWRAVGADVQVFLQQDNDLQSIISSHGYDALLYGISIGPDPDVFAFWHSSQADLRSPTRFNLSEYKSEPADGALEAGRTRSDPLIRVTKYRPFLEAWRNDVPALALYQPRFLYVTNTPVFNLKEHVINSGTDRFNNVSEWMIREGKVNR